VGGPFPGLALAWKLLIRFVRGPLPFPAHLERYPLVSFARTRLAMAAGSLNKTSLVDLTKPGMTTEFPSSKIHSTVTIVYCYVDMWFNIALEYLSVALKTGLLSLTREIYVDNDASCGA